MWNFRCRRHRRLSLALAESACEAAASIYEVPWVVDGVWVTVDDLDAHFERASAAGARMLSALEDSPHGRRDRVEDLEGHRWMFEERA